MGDMMKPKFAFIHNLETLSEEQRTKYLFEASEYFGLPGSLNALDLIWMHDEKTGMKKLAAYARKGTTDILRGIHGIEITALNPANGDGYVSFIAVGKDKTGRQEMAVGACDLSGLKGDKVAYAVMTAQTRAMRRLTLQFVGGGLLDESEVNPQTSNVATSAASLATLSGPPVVVPKPPTVAPNAAPGTVQTGGEIKAKVVAEQVPENVPFKEKAQYSEPQFVGQQDQIDTAWKQQADKQQDTKPAAAPASPAESTTSVDTKPDTGAAEIKPKAKRTRKKANTVSLEEKVSEPIATAEREEGAVSTGHTLNLPLPEIVKVETTKTVTSYVEVPPAQQISPKPPVSAPVEAVVSSKKIMAPLPAGIPDTPEVRQKLAAAIGEIPSVAATLDKEKFEDFRKRLKVYSNDILPKQGGMMPSEDVGGPPNKLRAFALRYTGGADVAKLSLTQWEDLFDFLDTYTKDNGAKALVEYINQSIGAK